MSGEIHSSGRRNFGAGINSTIDPELMSLMGLVKARRFAEVERTARRILGTRPDQPLALKALSFALLGLNRFEDALPILDYAILRNPQDPELHNNQGIALSSLMRWKESIVSFERARLLAPQDPELLKNIGGALIRMYRWDDAVPVLLEAIEKHPNDYVEAIALLAGALLQANRIDEAWICFRELHDNDENNLWVLYHLVSSSFHRCYWEGLMEQIALLRMKSANFSAPFANPFFALAFPGLGAADHRRIAEKYALEIVLSGTHASERTLDQFQPRADRKHLRIAYISDDFCTHAVGLVISEVIERHDRSLLEVFGYSTKADDGSDVRKRLTTAFDRFVDVEDMTINEVVDHIRADKVDILVDLSGWTVGGRPEVLAQRCAPVQVNWLGYAGTMGHPGLADYIIGDPVTAPLEHAMFFTETIAQLPHCYLPADTTRPIFAAPSRQAAGLPETAFVFCSFNNRYKFNPPLFDLWCRVLCAAPDSLLWLSHPGDSGAEALRGEIQRRGIEPGRLVFAEKLDSHADYCARIQLADLALDPFPYNSHTTGIDTLWAGVPMITLLGETFAGRVGASLLCAADLSELVAKTPEAYCELALRLYRDRQYLASLRKRLVDGRSSLPLFNMKSFARDLERLYFRIWQDFVDGKKEPIVLSPIA